MCWAISSLLRACLHTKKSQDQKTNVKNKEENAELGICNFISNSNESSNRLGR